MLTNEPDVPPTTSPEDQCPAHPSAAWVEALTPEMWARANRELLAKIITELVFEEVLHPAALDEDEAWGSGSTAFRLSLLPHGAITYRAVPRYLGHWRVDPASLRWHPAGAQASGHDDGGRTGTTGTDRLAAGSDLPDISEVVAMTAPLLGVGPSTTAGALGELANTLLADAWQLATGRPAAELADLVDREPAPARIECELRGHPWIVANKGRIGFDADDLAAYAPEAGRTLQLGWLAAAPDRADVRTVPGLDHPTVVREQLGDEAWHELRRRAAAAGLDPETAVYLPVHPWQWRHRILPHHAADVARGRLVPLGSMPPRYLPQQSIRTLVDADHPERRYLKLPLSILNTSVYRGLPRQRTLAAPALTEWFTDVCRHDPFLVETGLILLGEVAAVSVGHAAFEAVPDVPYQHTEMLGAIWRDSVAGHLGPEERAVSLAALLHRDPAGVPFLDPVIHRSGLGVADWVDQFHQAVLPPLVHVLYRYGATFSPHGQNCLLVMRHHAPRRLAVKDFVDDAMIAAEPLPELDRVPPAVRRCLGEGLEAPFLTQWIQGGLLVCVHRYLSELLAEHFGYPEAAFWSSARRALRTYQHRFQDELAHRFELFDLDAPTFVKLCLNRVRLFERGYTDAAERPVASARGWIDNPLALNAPDVAPEPDPERESEPA